MLAAIGEEEGYLVDTISWRDEGLREALGQHQHLVMLDWVSPPLAAPLVNLIRREHASTRIVVMIPSWSDLESGARLAADLVLHKPLRVNQVRRVLAEVRPPARHVHSAA